MVSIGSFPAKMIQSAKDTLEQMKGMTEEEMRSLGVTPSRLEYLKMIASSSVGNALVPEDEQEPHVPEKNDNSTISTAENGTTTGVLLKFDPTIELPEIKEFLNNPSPEEDPVNGDDTTMQQTKITGILAPLVKLGNTVIPFSAVGYMTLTDDPYPKVSMSITDRFDLIKTFDKPTRDNKLQIQIIPTFENAYKKINLTFWIENLSFEGNEIFINAVYNVPGFHDNVLKAYGEVTTYEFCEQIAKDLHLGFASNLDSTDDKRWIYIPNKKVYDALYQECEFGGSERQILTWWIDYWNCLNLVDIYERNNTIDKDLQMWVLPRRFPEAETGESTEPILMEAVITNNDIYRDFQIFASEYNDDLRLNKITDKIVETYKINDMEEDNFIIRDGDVNNDLFTKYEYAGENFGDHPYLKQKNCREMWVSKVNNSTIKVTLTQPCLGLMKGHKVNFYWYTVNEFTKDTKNVDNVNSNIPLPSDEERDKVSGLDGSKIDDDMIIDKQVSGQYYIVDSKISYEFNGGSYNWEHTFTLSRPEDQKEYFDWDSINITAKQ